MGNMAASVLMARFINGNENTMPLHLRPLAHERNSVFKLNNMSPMDQKKLLHGDEEDSDFLKLPHKHYTPAVVQNIPYIYMIIYCV